MSALEDALRHPANALVPLVTSLCSEMQVPLPSGLQEPQCMVTDPCIPEQTASLHLSMGDVNDLEEWRQRLRAGSVTSRELLETGQMASFLPYLQLLGDWQALNAYFAGLLKINVGLALLLRDKVRELQQRELGAWLKRTDWIPLPESLARPRPPTAPLAPPTLNGLA